MLRPAALLLALAAPAAGQDFQSPPPGGESLLPAGDAFVDAAFTNWANGDATREVVDIQGMPFERAVRITNTRPASPRYGVQLGVKTTGEIKEGDAVLVSFFVRGAADGGGPVSAAARLQQNGGEVERRRSTPGLVDLDVNAAAAGDQWRQFLQPARSPLTQPDGTHSFSVHLGDKAQTVEVGGLRILNYGPDRPLDTLPVTRVSYPGMAPDAPWRAAAADRIDRLRKADLTVTVKDAAGDPVPGAAVRVELKRHKFGFGTAADADLLVMTRDQFEQLVAQNHGSYVGLTWDDVLKYRSVVEENFNKVVLENDLKIGGWNAGEGNDGGRFRRDWTFAALDWLAERNIEARGHYGVWGPIDASQPWNTGGIDVGENYGPEMLKYVRGFVPQIAGRVGEWDAINHIVGWGPETLGKRYGTEYYAQVLKTMRELDPNAEMWVNEGNILSGGGQDPAYRQVIRELNDLGQTPDGAGFMAHFRDGSLTSPDDLLKTLDAYAELVPKLQLTELDYDGLNREAQAQYLGDVLTVAFSHPAMDGVVQWGFWEPRHWRPDAALWKEDWSLRPAGQRYRDLVLRDWHTDATVKTAADGTATVRGFKGDYEITATLPDGTAATATVTLNGDAAVTVTAN